MQYLKLKRYGYIGTLLAFPQRVSLLIGRQGCSMQTANILIIDDDITACKIGKRFLERDGFNVITAQSGEACFAALATHAIDAILLDILLPDTNGFDICQTLRSQLETKVLPVLMMTGLDDNDSINRAYDVGATDFVIKPISWKIVSNRMRYLLRASQDRKSLYFTVGQLCSSQSKLSLAQKIAKLGYWEWVVGEKDIYCSEEIKTLLAIQEDSNYIAKDTFFALVSEREREAVEGMLAQAIEDKTPQAIEHTMQSGDSTLQVYHSAESHIDSVNKQQRLVGVIQDITERKASEEKIHYLAYYDDLTGLPNQAFFKERLREEVEAAKRTESLLAIVFINIDEFKKINETLGHSAGDNVLKLFANQLKNCIRGSDTLSVCRDITLENVSRFGNDEFAILFANVDKVTDVALILKRIRQEFSTPINTGNKEIFIDINAGISIYPHDGQEEGELIKHAGSAIRHSKSKGKNDYTFYSSEMNHRALERFSVETNIRKSLEEDQFEMYYQPKLALEKDEFSSAEALLRWKRHELNSVSPGELINIAEEMGLIVDVGDWVINNVFSQLKKWESGILPDLKVAINISVLQLQKKDFLDKLKKAAKKYKIRPGMVELEITENTLMHIQERFNTLVNEIKEAGFSVAIDDFGTGYSSLQYLKYFPIDRLKIDRVFIQDICENQDSRAIIRAIISMSKSLSLQITAEGVEDQQQLGFLANAGCDEIQGYYFSQPLPTQEVEDFINNYRAKKRANNG